MYKINGTDLFTACGFLADSSRESSNSLERLADPAEVFSHTWDNGAVDYDLTTVPGKKARVFKLSGVITATSETDYIAKKAAFEALIRAQIATIYNDETGITVQGKLAKVSDWSRMTPIKGATTIATRVSVEFNELLGIALPVYDVFYGPYNVIPTTATQILSLNSGPIVNNTMTLNTGVNRIFVVAVQLSRSLVNVLDTTVREDITTEYIERSTIKVNNVDMKIYVMENAISYSENHAHVLTFTAI